jgi:hypothetical protein
MDEYEEHMSKRESIASKKRREENFVIDYEVDGDRSHFYEKSAFEDEEESLETIMKQIQIQKEKDLGKAAFEKSHDYSEIYQLDPRK